MTAVQEINERTITVFGARNDSGDDYFSVHPGKMTDEEIIALNPRFWITEEAAADGLDADYDRYMNSTVTLEPGDYTVSFTSSESSDYFYDLIKGHVTDKRVLRAYAMDGSEDWWGYDEKITDPNLGVDEGDNTPNPLEAILLTVI